MRRILFALLALGTAASLPAQREAVLEQIKVPHPYYFREMYLPQLTTGPSGAAWTPDGTALVYSMRGSLWRQTLGSTVATQLTAGGGYDYQPDVSPDGKWVAFDRYDGKSVELELLELPSGKITALTSNRAVNLEPRWSPDGSRLAFVSTVFEGRWHVYTMEVRDGRGAEPVRITTDRDSKLPRYYYSVYDHYLSPTWSPDGKELILVSNRGQIWGTGGFWRMRAEPSDSMRLIHFEETTWKARPDWSPDGKRVVYSSYVGTQFNQLWLMTSDGGVPFELTYGAFDATSPRWSRDARHIAYISNDGGNTALWVLDMPGAAKHRVEPRTLKFIEAVGALTIDVVDEAGRPLDARISVTGADGRSWAPQSALMHADDSFDRSERHYEVGYFHSPGSASLTIPAGPMTVEVTHGLEYAVRTQTVQVAAGDAKRLRVTMRRLVDLPARGWYSGDLHVHMNYGGTYRTVPKQLAFMARAEDLHVIEELIVNKEQRVPDISYFGNGAPDPVSTPSMLIVHGQEFHTSYWGHSGLLGLTKNIILPGYAAYANTPAASLYPANANVFDLGHAQGALTGYVHPFDELPNPEDTVSRITSELPVDVALGKVDYMEILGFSDHRSTAAVWYRLLNCGFRIPAGAGTDAMTNFASLRGPVGMNRVYVHSGPKLDHASFLRAIKAGHTFATNGPLLSLAVNGKEPGDEIAFPLGSHTISVHAVMHSIVPVEHLELVQNGRVVATLPLSADHKSASATVKLPVDRSGWITLRAWSEHATPPVLDIYPFATTSPVYLTIAGIPPRSPDDARFFMDWVDRLREGAEQHTGYNSADEKASVLALISRARAEFEKRAYEIAVSR
ncbi:MAG TPA: CehA/McbA family metallohydrolase [Gemmatimonadaceae bacterium]|nr:CehA/McbA family metallohydrolase [Gemmatimonadaceae bacterium]